MHLLLAVLPAGSRGRGLRRQSFSSPQVTAGRSRDRELLLCRKQRVLAEPPLGGGLLLAWAGWPPSFWMRRLDARGFFPAVLLGHPSTL